MPQLANIQQVSDGWIKKYVLTYNMENGTQHTYEVASRKSLEDYRAFLEAKGAAPRPDAVSIVGRTANDTLLMIREFRYPLNSWCIAFPAGLVEPGEDLTACADRELREETGYGIVEGTRARALPQAGYSSTGLTDEAVQIIVADIEPKEDAHPEPNELIETFELPVEGIAHFLDTNTTPIGTRAQLMLEALSKRW